MPDISVMPDGGHSAMASLMQCSMTNLLRYFTCFEVPVLGAVMIFFFNTSNTAAVS
jgi:hypothetical protein